MATETLELKTPELVDDSPPKEEVAVADSVKKEAPVRDDAEKKKKEEQVEKDEAKDETMEKKGEEENDKERCKSPVTPVSERPTRERKRTERYILDTPCRSSGNKPVSIEQV